MLALPTFCSKTRTKEIERIRRYQRCRNKSLSQKTDKTMAYEMKLKTTYVFITLHWSSWSNWNPTKTFTFTIVSGDYFNLFISFYFHFDFNFLKVSNKAKFFLLILELYRVRWHLPFVVILEITCHKLYWNIPSTFILKPKPP